MARRPLKQLLREARESETSRRKRTNDFSNWLGDGIGRRADELTRQARFSFEGDTLRIDFDFPTAETVDAGSGRRFEWLQLQAEMALRCVHHTLQQDRSGAVRFVVFDGHIDTIDLSTGRDIRPSVVHFEVERDRFDQLDLARVEPVTCLRGLGASLALEQPASSFWAV